MNQPKIIEPLNVTIRNREKVIFSGKVNSLTSVNDQGLFDVLPQHSNFISIIKDYVTVRAIDNTEQRFDLTTGVMQVANNIVNIFLGILTPKVTPQRKISALEYLKNHPTKQK